MHGEVLGTAALRNHIKTLFLFRTVPNENFIAIIFLYYIFIFLMHAKAADEFDVNA